MKLLKLQIVLFLISASSIAQNNTLSLSGIVVNSISGLSIANAHIVNLNSRKGTITNKVGYFEIQGVATDSVHISYISFRPIFTTIYDLLLTETIVIELKPISIDMDEIILQKGSWQQFKLEFVQTAFKNEQSSEILLERVSQYKGPLRPFKPSVASVITNPISTIYYFTNKKERQKRKTKRYQKVIQDSSYIDD